MFASESYAAMKRSELEHILRASKSITGESEFVVIGSQSILGPIPDAPRALRQSIEVDLYPRRKPELSAAIERSLGELSRFHQTYGYYADGVSPTTATLPDGWEERLLPLCNENTDGATGWCLEPHDLAYSKLAARRGKDLTFVTRLLHFRLVRPSRLRRLIEGTADGDLREKLADAFTFCRHQRQAPPSGSPRASGEGTGGADQSDSGCP